MARDAVTGVARFGELQGRLDQSADILSLPASGAESAAAGWIDRAGYVPDESDTFGGNGAPHDIQVGRG